MALETMLTDDELATALEAFVTRFAAGAGPTYHWSLVDGCLTAALPPPEPLPAEYGDEGITAVRMCPLSAQATLETGRVLYAWDYYHAADVLRIDVDTRYAVMSAADRTLNLPDVLRLRARLLRICGLEERL